MMVLFTVVLVVVVGCDDIALNLTSIECGLARECWRWSKFCS